MKLLFVADPLEDFKIVKDFIERVRPRHGVAHAQDEMVAFGGFRQCVGRQR